MSNINTNMSAVNTLYHLQKNMQGMDKAMERIASGMRITNAGDDAAGAAIVNRMTSQVKGLENAIRNASDAISLAQTAEGALNEVTAILQRIRELSVQSANGVYNGADRQSLNAEVVQLQNELQRIAETTYFNDTKLLNGTFQDTTFQIGYLDEHKHTVTIEDVRPGALGEYTLSTSQASEAYALDQNGDFIPADANTVIEPSTGLKLDGTSNAVAQVSVYNVDYAGFNANLDTLDITIDGQNVRVNNSNIVDQGSFIDAIAEAVENNPTLDDRYVVLRDKVDGNISFIAREAGNPFAVEITHVNNAIQLDGFTAAEEISDSAGYRQLSIEMPAGLQFGTGADQLDLSADSLTLRVNQTDITIPLGGAINSLNDLANEIADQVENLYPGTLQVRATSTNGSVTLSGTGATPYFTASISFTDASADGLDPFTLSEASAYENPVGLVNQTLDITGNEDFDEDADTMTLGYRGTNYTSLTEFDLTSGAGSVTEAEMAELVKTAVADQSVSNAQMLLTLKVAAGGADIGAANLAVNDQFTIAVDGTNYTTAKLADVSTSGLLTAIQNATSSSGARLDEIFTITNGDNFADFQFTHVNHTSHALSASALTSPAALSYEVTNTLDLGIDGMALSADHFTAGDRLVFDVDGTRYVSAAIADADSDGVIAQSDIVTALNAAVDKNAGAIAITFAAGDDFNQFTVTSTAPTADVTIDFRRSLALDLSRHDISVTTSADTLTFENSAAADQISLSATDDSQATNSLYTINLNSLGAGIADATAIADGDQLTITVDNIDYTATIDSSGASVTQAFILSALQSATNANGERLDATFSIAAGASFDEYTLTDSVGANYDISVSGLVTSGDGTFANTAEKFSLVPLLSDGSSLTAADLAAGDTLHITINNTDYVFTLADGDASGSISSSEVNTALSDPAVVGGSAFFTSVETGADNGLLFVFDDSLVSSLSMSKYVSGGTDVAIDARIRETNTIQVNGANVALSDMAQDDARLTFTVDGVDYISGAIKYDAVGSTHLANLTDALNKSVRVSDGVSISSLGTFPDLTSAAEILFNRNSGVSVDLDFTGIKNDLTATVAATTPGDALSFGTSGNMQAATAQVATLDPTLDGFDIASDTLTININQTSLALARSDLLSVRTDFDLARVMANKINASTELQSRVSASVNENGELEVTALSGANTPALFSMSLDFAAGSTWELATDTDTYLDTSATAYAVGNSAIAVQETRISFNESGLDPANDTFDIVITGTDASGNAISQTLTVNVSEPSSGIVFVPGSPISSQDLAELAMLEINNNATLASIVQARIPTAADYSSEGVGAYLNHLDEIIVESMVPGNEFTINVALNDAAAPLQKDLVASVDNQYATAGASGLYLDTDGAILDGSRHQRFVNSAGEVTEYRVADNGKLINEDGYVVARDPETNDPYADGRLMDVNGVDTLARGSFRRLDSDGNLTAAVGTPSTALITGRTAVSGALLLGGASAATPISGTSASDAVSRVIDAEDLTVFGPVGKAEVNIRPGMTAKEVAEAVTAQAIKTGVRATAETRVQISFDKLAGASLTDAISFTLYGMDGEPADVTASIDFGGAGNGSGSETLADLSNLRNAINARSGATGITATLSDDKQTVYLISVDGYDIVMENYDAATIRAGMTAPPMRVQSYDDTGTAVGAPVLLSDSSTPGAVDTARVTGQVTFHSSEIFSVHTAADGAAGGGLFQAAPGAANLTSISDLDILTVASASKMLNVIDGALTRIDAERGDLGATMNRMQYTINNLSNIVVNTKESRSRIQDSDIATETANLTKSQVLQQAAQAMLAQANQTAQSVLSLLQ